jgi:FixJ family two-component response regulator
MNTITSNRRPGAPTVIVIDDDLSVLNALARLIRSANYEVMTFHEPRAVLEAQLPAANACLIVDVNMPQMNGAELCEALAGHGRSLPVIFITGRTDSATRALAARVPSIAVLFKPFDEDLLLPAISSALRASG